jgi:hypothetical protein
MHLRSIGCPVLGTRVSLLTTFEGEVTGVICPEYESVTCGCRIKQRGSGGGPLSVLLERVAGDGLSYRHTTLCEFHRGSRR